MSVLFETLIQTPGWSPMLSIATLALSLPSQFTFSGSKWVAVGEKTSSRDYSEG